MLRIADADDDGVQPQFLLRFGAARSLSRLGIVHRLAMVGTLACGVGP